MRPDVLLRLIMQPVFWGLLIALPVFAPVAAANQAALAWLGVQVQTDGSYGQPVGIATTTQATAETLRTLHADTGAKASPSSLAYLEASAGQNVTEYLARAVIAETEAGSVSAELVSALESNQNADGGFGGAAGFSSNALDTAYALEALAKTTGSHNTVLSAAASYLSSHQNADGSYTLNSNGQSANYTTAAVLMALNASRLRFDLAGPVNNALRYLLSSQDSTGAWGNDFETAWVVLALAPATTDTTPVSAAVSVLENAQLTDGSWGQDVYTTALAARALLKKPGIRPPSDAVVTGHAINQGNGLPLAGVLVTGSGGQTARTGADGSFRLQGVASGTQTVNLSLDGFSPISRSVSLAAGQALDLGTLSLTALPDSGIVQGSVTDAANGQPLAGVSVILGGSGTAAATTDATGFYRIVAPPGALTITAAAPNYWDASGTATLAAGSTLTFSPGLVANTATPPATANLSGTVLDASTGKALTNVSVVLAGSPTGAVTDAGGKFALTGLAPGTFTLELALTGYQSIQVSLTAPAGNSDLGTIPMQPVAANGNTLAGVVTDSATGAPLPGALVAISTEGKSVYTAADGSYRIGAVAQSQFTVAVSAAGYLSRQGGISLTQTGLTIFNVTLDRAAGNNFDIAPLALAQADYPANSKVKVPVQMVNTAATERQVRLYGVIENAGAQVIGQFPARSVPLGGDPASALVTVPANGPLNDEVEWHNGATAPGDYRFIVQAYDGSSGQLLAERSVPFKILPTTAIGGSAEFNPPIAQLAAQQPVSITAKISNRGNLGLEGGTVTAKVTLKNTGYQSSNAVTELQTIAVGNGLTLPFAIDRDRAGNIYVANYSGSTLSRIDPKGAVTQVASGFSNPVDVDVAPNGDIYVLNSYNTYVKLAADGSRQQFITGVYNKAIEALPDGKVLVAAGTNGVYEFTSTGVKTKLTLTGLTNPTEIQADARGVVYIGDYSQGKIFRLGTGNVLETVQASLPTLETFAIATDGTLAVVYGSTKMALVLADGTRREIDYALPFYVYGLAWDADGAVIASVYNTNTVFKLYPPSTQASNVPVGTSVYTRSLALPPLALGSVAVPLDFGSWTPALSGDFQVELTVDNHSEYGSVANTLHVGPNAHGSIGVANSTVRPGDQADTATISVLGADSTSITRIDPKGTSLAAASNTSGRGIAADTKGNIYATNYSTASSIVKISPSGKVSTFVTGYTFGYGLAIDSQDSLYSYSNSATSTVLKISPTATVTTLATLSGAIRGLAIGPDGLLYAVDTSNALSRIYPDGRVEVVTRDGTQAAQGLTIDANGYFYIQTTNYGTHKDEDGVNRSYQKIIRISRDGKRYSEYLTQGYFEGEGINLTADCSNNLMYAPLSDYPLKGYGEESTLLQLVGDTGEERLVLYGPSIDPAMSDMDVLFYDRFGKRILIWTDLAAGKIFSFPVVCGGIDADVHLITRSDVNVSGLTPAPDQSIDLGNGSVEHVWSLKQVDNRGVNLNFNLLLKGLAEGESRPIAQEGYIEFHNSFVPGQNVRAPLTIPEVRATYAVRIQPALDASQYGPLALVNISAGVTNNGAQPFNGHIELGIVDAAGFPVQDLPPITVSGQPGLSTAAYPALWNTGLFLAGDYALKTVLYDERGEVAASGTVPFAIVHNTGTPGLSDTLSPDKASYTGWDRVQLDGSVGNTSVNALLGPTVMTVSVTAPDGAVIYTGSAATSELVPGSARAVSFSFPLVDAANGLYTVAVKLSNAADGTVLDSFQKTFTVTRTALQELTGTVVAAPNPVAIGTPVTCSESVDNHSSGATAPLTLSSVLVKLDNATIISEKSRSLILNGGQAGHDDNVLDTSALTPGDYACVLRALDNGAVKDLASATFKAVPPQITLGGTVFHDLDHSQSQNGIEPAVHTGGFRVTALSNGVAVATAPVKADGSYQLTVQGLADYTLVLSGTANATVAALPVGWSSTGEIQNGTADAAVDGTLAVSTGIHALSALDFAIDGAPSSAGNDSATTTVTASVTVFILANDPAGVGTTRLLADSIDLDPSTPGVDTSKTLPGIGSYSVQPDGTLRFTPLPSFSGISSLTYLVHDDLGQATNSAEVTVTVTGPANPGGDLSTDQPHANADAAATQANTPVTLAVTLNDVAGPGASLDVATLDLDTATPGVQNVQTIAAGLWQANGDGTVTFTPNVGYSGKAPLAYALADSNGSIAGSTLTVVVTGGDQPAALDDSGTTSPGIALNLSALNNDYASAGQVLTAAIDLDPGTQVPDTLLSTAEGGWRVNADGTITYTPAQGFSGDASLNYAVQDSAGLSATASIRVTVLPTQPPATTDDTAGTAFNTPVTLSPAANDKAEPSLVIDPATLDLDPATGAVESTATTAEGSWQVRPDGSLSYTPALNYYGAASLNYLIRDSLGRAATARVTVTVAPPVSVTVSGRVFHDFDHNRQQNGSEPGTDAGGVFITAVDSNARAAATTAVNADGSYRFEVPPLSGLTLVLSTQGSSTVAGLPTGWNFTGETQAGVADASADGLQAIQTQVLSLTELNFAIDADPSAAGDDRATTAHAVPVTVPVLANDRPGPGTSRIDPATLDLDPATPATDPQASLAGQGVYAAQTDGSVTFTPDPVFTGISQLSYQVRDNLGQLTNTAKITVAVGPDAQDDSLGTPANTQATGSVAGNDLIVAGALYSLQTPATHGTASLDSDGSYHYTPNTGYQGADAFSYSVCLPPPDAAVCDTATVNITITPPPIDLRGTLETGAHGPLLVLVDPLDEACQHEDDGEESHGSGDKGRKSSLPSQNSGGHAGEDGEEDDGDGHNCQAQLAERDTLGRVLQAGGWSYRLVDSAESYTSALHSHAYSLHALLSGQVKLDEAVQRELREAVNHGDGLLVGGSHDQRNNVLDSVLGIQYQGHSTAYAVKVTPRTGYDGFQRPLLSAADVNRISLQTASVYGQFTGAGNKTGTPALTHQSYGYGEAAYLAFDLPKEAAQAEPAGIGVFSQLLLNLLDDLGPVPDNRPGEVIPLKLRVRNAGQAVSGWVDVVLDNSLTLYDNGGATPQPDGSLRWTYTLAVNETLEHQAWARLPATGTSAVQASLHAAGSPQDPYSILRLNLPLADSPALDSALASFNALTKAERPAYQSARLSAQRAAAALASSRTGTARDELLKTADSLIRLNTARAAAIRQAVDEALRRLPPSSPEHSHDLK